jgi:hypothetical protein
MIISEYLFCDNVFACHLFALLRWPLAQANSKLGGSIVNCLVDFVWIDVTTDVPFRKNQLLSLLYYTWKAFFAFKLVK